MSRIPGARFGGISINAAPLLEQQAMLEQIEQQKVNFQIGVANPFQLRQAELDMINQQADVVAGGIQSEVEHSESQNLAQGFEDSAGLVKGYLDSDPLTRYEQRESFLNQSERLYKLNPSPHTQDTYRRFAYEYIQSELEGPPPPPPASQRAPGDVGIKYNGKTQIKDGNKFVDAKPSKMGDKEFFQATKEFEKLAKKQERNIAKLGDIQKSGNEKQIARHRRLIDDTQSKLDSMSANIAAQAQPEPEPQPAPVQPRLTFQDNLERLQNLHNRFRHDPELAEPIKQRLESEMQRPQYWAGQFDTYYSQLPEGAKGIVDKAKNGKIISPFERGAVEKTIDEIIKDGGKTASTYKQTPGADLLMKFPTLDPGTQAAVRSAYPHVKWPESSAQPTAPALQPGPSPTIASKPAPAVTSQPTAPATPATPDTPAADTETPPEPTTAELIAAERALALRVSDARRAHFRDPEDILKKKVYTDLKADLDEMRKVDPTLISDIGVKEKRFFKTFMPKFYNEMVAREEKARAGAVPQSTNAGTSAGIDDLLKRSK